MADEVQATDGLGNRMVEGRQTPDALNYPTCGRIVHYHGGGGIMPLIVNSCDEDGFVSGHVFPKMRGSHCVEHVPHADDALTVDMPCWAWPPRS